MSNKTIIRDPVHNYIYITDVEENVVQHPLFQRLRNISQNGAAYYTYPSNKHCRFLHSLGVMKVGGDIFLNATEDFTDEDVQQFLYEAFELLKQKSIDIGTNMISVAGDFQKKKNKTFLKYGLILDGVSKDLKRELEQQDSLFALKLSRIILFQSLRLACLLHDVGHFPYSHTIEHTFAHFILILQMKKNNQEFLTSGEKTFLEDYIKMKKKIEIDSESKKIHEMIGIKMLDDILPSENLDNFQRLCRAISKQIIERSGHDRILQTLYDIVSGELDADRLDYSIRDPFTSGLELGKIDIERLLNNFCIIKEGEHFKILPKVQALSSIESFFHQRYLVYKYLLYHHSKVRMDQIIGEITLLLIKIYFSTDQELIWVQKILKERNFHFMWSKINGNTPIAGEGDENYYYCDESWFNSLIKEIHNKFRTEDAENKILQALGLLLKTFILRKTDNILSFIKRYDMYLDFFTKIYSKLPKEHKVDYDLFRRDCIDLITDGVLEDFKELLLEKYQVILLLKSITPKTVEFDAENNAILKIIVGESKKAISIDKVSPYLQSLNLINNADQLFHIFFIGEDIKLSKFKENIIEEMFEFLKSKYLEGAVNR